MEEHFYIRVAEIGYSMPEGFKKSEFKERGQFSDTEKGILDDYFLNAWNDGTSGGNRETFFYILKKISSAGEDDSIYILKSDILFSYIDYLELQEARQSSKQAKKWATIAIWVSIIGIGIQIVTSIFSSTMLDNQQFNEIIKQIENKK